jgi:hypothetical protein
MSSVERNGPILPIDRKEFSGFWSKALWIRFLQGTGEKGESYINLHINEEK